MRTNAAEWAAMHEEGTAAFPGSYFKSHKYYQGGMYEGGFDVGIIPKFITLGPEMTALIIGAGYGRETAFIAPRIKRVYCIDVKSEKLEQHRAAFLGARKITNTTDLIYEPGWEEKIEPLDFAYSFTVFQHVTRDITDDYFRGVAARLKSTGRLLFQFCERLKGGQQDPIPGLVYEPQINWSRSQIEIACAFFDLRILKLITPKTITQNKKAYLWHWLLAGRK
jgi:cyclopropane fatty-acyl-phospholipid synthase-like methyltransferase